MAVASRTVWGSVCYSRTLRPLGIEPGTLRLLDNTTTFWAMLPQYIRQRDWPVSPVPALPRTNCASLTRGWAPLLTMHFCWCKSLPPIEDVNALWFIESGCFFCQTPLEILWYDLMSMLSTKKYTTKQKTWAHKYILTDLKCLGLDISRYFEK